MQPFDPYKFLLAAKTAFHLFEIIHDLLWQLFPEELLALSQDSEKKLMLILAQALADKAKSTDT